MKTLQSLWLGTFLLVAGCAPSNIPTPASLAKIERAAHQARVATIKRQSEKAWRLGKISWTMARFNATLCPKTRWDFGFHYLWPGRSEDEKNRAAWREAVNTNDEEVTIAYVAPNSPAAKAGFQDGDKIIKINSLTLTSGRQAERVLKHIGKTISRKAEIFVTVQREQQRLAMLPMRPVKICAYHPALLKAGDGIYSTADSFIYLTEGMMRFTQNDAEVALVIGHEMGRLILGHSKPLSSDTHTDIARASDNLAAGLMEILWKGGKNTIAPVPQGATPAAQNLEKKADYAGIYYAARAGFDITNAASFWARVPTHHTKDTQETGTQEIDTMAKEARIVSIKTTVQEVEKKRAANQSLVPKTRR